MQIRMLPTLCPAVREQQLASLLIGGVLTDTKMAVRLERLDDIYATYLTCYPYGLWAPGLCLNNEMRSYTNLLLPLKEIQSGLQRLLALALRYRPASVSLTTFTAKSWLDMAAKLQPFVVKANPTDLLRRLLADETFRRAFLFALLVPRHHGGGFARYPQQQSFLLEWLQKWLRQTRSGNKKRKLCCLDAACGNGTGTYGLTRLLFDCGFTPDELEVHGTSLEPLELVTAAYCYYPHDKALENEVAGAVRPLLASGVARKIEFYQEDLLLPAPGEKMNYQLILCNGILGGPFLSDPMMVGSVIANLVARLSPGGLLLATNHFHEGWQKKMSDHTLAGIFRQVGLEVLVEDDGVVGKTAD